MPAGTPQAAGRVRRQGVTQDAQLFWRIRPYSHRLPVRTEALDPPCCQLVAMVSTTASFPAQSDLKITAQVQSVQGLVGRLREWAAHTLSESAASRLSDSSSAASARAAAVCVSGRYAGPRLLQ